MAGEAKEPLLQDRIDTVPERQRETQDPFLVAPPEEAVLAPSVGAAAGVLVREILPGIATRAVVLSHGAPLTFGEGKTLAF